VQTNDKYELFRLWVEGKLPHQHETGKDHHAVYAVKRFEMWLASQPKENNEHEQAG